MRLNALCEESSHWETGPNGTILASGIGEIGACRAFEAMCYSDSLMRPRRLEMLHRNCWQSSPPAQNPRPALRFRLDKRDECDWPSPCLLYTSRKRGVREQFAADARGIVVLPVFGPVVEVDIPSVQDGLHYVLRCV